MCDGVCKMLAECVAEVASVLWSADRVMIFRVKLGDGQFKADARVGLVKAVGYIDKRSIGSTSTGERTSSRPMKDIATLLN